MIQRDTEAATAVLRSSSGQQYEHCPCDLELVWMAAQASKQKIEHGHNDQRYEQQKMGWKGEWQQKG